MRTAGFSIVGLATVAPALQFLFVGMMYVVSDHPPLLSIWTFTHQVVSVSTSLPIRLLSQSEPVTCTRRKRSEFKKPKKTMKNSKRTLDQVPTSCITFDVNSHSISGISVPVSSFSVLSKDIESKVVIGGELLDNFSSSTLSRR